MFKSKIEVPPLKGLFCRFYGREFAAFCRAGTLARLIFAASSLCGPMHTCAVFQGFIPGLGIKLVVSPKCPYGCLNLLYFVRPGGKSFPPAIKRQKPSEWNNAGSQKQPFFKM